MGPWMMMMPPPTLPASECVTVTARASSEILQPLADQDTPHLSDLSVEIHVGERLCLAIVREAKGRDIKTFRLVAHGRAPEVTFELQLVTLPDDTTALVVRNHGDDHAFLALLAPLGASDHLANRQTIAVAANYRAFEVFPGPVKRVVVAGGYLATRSEDRTDLLAPPETGAQRIDRNGVSLGMGVTGAYGARTLHQPELSRELAQNHHSLPGSTQELFGGSLWFELGRVRLDLKFSTGENEIKSYETGSTASLRATTGGIDVGWELLRRKGLLLYPFVGVGSTFVQLDATDADPAVLPSLVPSPAQGRTVGAGGAVLDFGVALEQLVTTFSGSTGGYMGLTLGTKLGYQLQLSHSDWSGNTTSDDLSYHGGPRVGVGGFYGLINVGVALRAASSDRSPVRPP